jgi:putative endonuclease
MGPPEDDRGTGCAKRVNSIAKGSEYEREAERFLTARGLRPVTRNFRCRLGEIDLIMEDGETLVFVEVRYRQSVRFGSPLESVTDRKRERVIRAAQYYLAGAGTYRDRPCRFDALGITGNARPLRIDWIKDAFSA